MKLLCCLVFGLIIAQIGAKSVDQFKLYAKLQEQCAKELNLDISNLPNYYLNYDSAIQEDNYSRFYACVMDKLHNSAGNGKISAETYDGFGQYFLNDVMRDVERKLLAIQALKGCKNVTGFFTGDSPVAIGMKFKKCFTDARLGISMQPRTIKPSCFNNNDILIKYDPKGVCSSDLKGVDVLSLPTLDERLGKFLVCAWQQLRILNEDGTINVKSFEDFVRDQVLSCHYFETDSDRETAITTTVDRCTNIKEATEEETAIGLHQCMKMTLPVVGAALAQKRIEALKYSLH